MTTLPQALTDTHVVPVHELAVKIFADGADLPGMLAMYADPVIKGFTTNPTLMRKAGVTDYQAFARRVLEAIPDRSISFEVFSDDLEDMERQAVTIAAWGKNVYVKIPVTTTTGESCEPVIRRLAHQGVQQNVTALMTVDQVAWVAAALAAGPRACISVFAGRIADTGRDPTPIMVEALRIMSSAPQLELIWASPRELLNIYQADAIGCHIITVTNDVLAKLKLVNKELATYSLETVQMFRQDAVASAMTL